MGFAVVAISASVLVTRLRPAQSPGRDVSACGGLALLERRRLNSASTLDELKWLLCRYRYGRMYRKTNTCSPNRPKTWCWTAMPAA
ncbi:hypothetical protein [Pseudoxanthomonas spadix]|uniref:hypothetical protein n=1 Tax=Pseudoxanthomonas spadix TaxID=415229 RepID=UPI001475AD34|nr:hypothetical protein [Pseudoxanthomonas spadix]